MSSLADILNSGRHALRVQRLAMQVISQNTANVNTEGYSRRRVDLATAPPFDNRAQWYPGGGVDVQFLGRVRDRIVDEQVRRSNSELAYWNRRDDTLGRIEEIFGEMGDAALSGQLQQFWAAWQDLANNPEGMAARMQLVQRAQSLASAVRRAHGELSARATDLDAQVRQSVGEANALTSRIAALNVQIVRAETDGHEASDLRDARDLAIDRLSQIMDIAVQENADGAVNIYSSGQILVQTDQSVELAMTSVSANGTFKTAISYGGSGRALQTERGELRALLDLRDQDIGGVMADLDAFASTLASRVNAVHRTGYGLGGSSGVDFFAGDVTGAANLRISEMILDDSSRIAAAGAPDAPGDNSLALQIAGIQNERLLQNGQTTLDAFYRDSVLKLGTRKAFAANELTVVRAANENLLNRREQISGVSMDEEMARLVQVQQAYEAAAKIINTVDEMMKTVLSLGSG